jgi:hypothetical protein
LCLAEANNAVIEKTAEKIDVMQAIVFKACPKHAEYGRAHLSRELPQGAYINIGVDHLSLDDEAGKGAGADVISPMRP